MNVTDVLEDLVAEQQALDAVVGGLTSGQWQLPTPSPGWTITDQIGHLAFFDAAAVSAITDPDAFAAHRAELFRDRDPARIDEQTLGRFRRLPAGEQLVTWRRHRDELEAAARSLEDGRRVTWYGPSMGATSFLTARLMEVWAHGQDVVDTLGASRPATDRLRHVAQLGVITRRWSYANRGEEPPPGDVRVELTAPSGERWTWGGDDAVATVAGPAEDFCLVVTQRRHLDDTRLAVTGEAGRDWMLKAQAFAGAATDGPSPAARPGPA